MQLRMLLVLNSLYLLCRISLVILPLVLHCWRMYLLRSIARIAERLLLLRVGLSFTLRYSAPVERPSLMWTCDLVFHPQPSTSSRTLQQTQSLQLDKQPNSNAEVSSRTSLSFGLTHTSTAFTNYDCHVSPNSVHFSITCMQPDSQIAQLSQLVSQLQVPPTLLPLPSHQTARITLVLLCLVSRLNKLLSSVHWLLL